MVLLTIPAVLSNWKLIYNHNSHTVTWMPFVEQTDKKQKKNSLKLLGGNGCP